MTTDQFLFYQFLEKLKKKKIFNRIYNFLLKKGLLNPNQSESLPCKLKSMGISGELYNLLENYLSGRFQRVVLNG